MLVHRWRHSAIACWVNIIILIIVSLACGVNPCHSRCRYVGLYPICCSSSVIPITKSFNVVASYVCYWQYSCVAFTWCLHGRSRPLIVLLFLLSCNGSWCLACGAVLLQPLVAVVYIGSAAVAVSICDYLPLRRRNILVSGCVAAASMAYCLNNISCCSVFFVEALSYETTCCGGRPVRGRNLWLLFTLRDLAHIARFVVYRFPCFAWLFYALNLWILGGENFWRGGSRTESYSW